MRVCILIPGRCDPVFKAGNADSDTVLSVVVAVIVDEIVELSLMDCCVEDDCLPVFNVGCWLLWLHCVLLELTRKFVLVW